MKVERGAKRSGSWFLRYCARFGEADQGLAQPLLAFLFFVLARAYLQQALMAKAVDVAQAASLTLFYYGLAASLVLLLHGLTGRPLLYVLRIVFPGMVVTLVPPLLDGTVFAAMGSRYGQLPASSVGALTSAYLHWFGPLTDEGVTLGMRVEVALATLAVFAFVYAHTGSLARSIVGWWLAYSTLFLWVALPSIVSLQAGATASSSQPSMLLSVLLTLACFARHDPGAFVAMWRDARWARLLHYELMFGLGLGISPIADAPRSVDVDGVLSIALGACAVALAWMFAVVNNNVHDVEVDRINAPSRPLITGAIDSARYQRYGWWALGLAGACALGVQAAALMLIGIFCGGYFVYSTPPLRLKRNCAISKLVIGLNSLACLTLGAGLTTGEVHIPAAIGWGAFVWFSLGANMIDLKDVEGDRAAGIQNIATLLGKRRAQWILGCSAVVAHALFWATFRASWLSSFVGALGLVQFWTLTRLDYRDGLVMAVQNLGLAATVAYAWHG